MARIKRLFPPAVLELFISSYRMFDLHPQNRSGIMLMSRVNITKEEGHVQEEMPSGRCRPQAGDLTLRYGLTFANAADDKMESRIQN